MLAISLSLALPWGVCLLVWRLDLGPAQAGLEFSFPGAGVVTGMTTRPSVYNVLRATDFQLPSEPETKP